MKPKKRKKWLYIVLIVAGLWTIGLIQMLVEKSNAPPPRKSTQTTKPVPKQQPVPKQPISISIPKTPDWQKAQFSAWDGSHRNVVRHIKKFMHDPKSFKHVKTTYINMTDNKHRLITMVYRGKNAFGATVRNVAIVKVDLNGNVVSVISNN